MPNARACSWRTAGGEVLELDRNGWRCNGARAPMAGARAGSHPCVIARTTEYQVSDYANALQLSQSAPRGVPVPSLAYHSVGTEAEAALPRCECNVAEPRARARGRR